PQGVLTVMNAKLKEISVFGRARLQPCPFAPAEWALAPEVIEVVLLSAAKASARKGDTALSPARQRWVHIPTRVSPSGATPPRHQEPTPQSEKPRSVPTLKFVLLSE